MFSGVFCVLLLLFAIINRINDDDTKVAIKPQCSESRKPSLKVNLCIHIFERQSR
jgi:hypothetical protein